MVFRLGPIILAILRAKMYRIRCLGEGQGRRRGGFGEVSERLIELVSKTSVLFIEYRGFESRPLRFASGKKGQLDTGQTHTGGRQVKNETAKFKSF